MFTISPAPFISAPLNPVTKGNFLSILRSWQGTPFHHGAALKGVGCDCYGLIVGALAEAGGHPPAPPLYPEDPQTLTPHQQQAVRQHFLGLANIIPREDTRDGDILVFSLQDNPVHFAWRLSPETFLHADRRQGVVETRYTPAWQRRHRLSARLIPVLGD
jgi:NlpC/P60 family putative phage cell wall peptidase